MAAGLVVIFDPLFFRSAFQAIQLPFEFTGWFAVHHRGVLILASIYFAAFGLFFRWRFGSFDSNSIFLFGIAALFIAFVFVTL